MLKRFSIFLMTLGGFSSLSAQPIEPPQTCDYGAPHEAAPEEMAEFAFLIGDYRIDLHRWQDDQWSPPQPGVTARWNGRYILGGMAIMDEWFHPDPAQDNGSGRGVNVRMYDPETEEWDMMWISSLSNQVQDLRAKQTDGVLTMWQEYPERPDFRAEFEVIDDDNWRRISYGKSADGEWVKQFMLSASRIACDMNGE